MNNRYIMKKELYLTFLFILTACSGSKPLKKTPFADFTSFEINNILKDNEQYTRHKYITNGASRNYAYDYTLTVAGRRIPVSISGREISDGYLIGDNSMSGVNYPSNSNFIYDGINYIYFDGRYLHKFSDDLELTQSILISEYDYIYGSSIKKDEADYTLIVEHNDVVTELSKTNATIYKVSGETYEIKESIYIFNNNSLIEYTEIASFNEINAFYKNDLSEFIMNGCVYSYNGNENSLMTDKFCVLSQPTFDGTNYVYKAIKKDEKKLIIDFNHSYNQTSDNVIEIDTNGLMGFKGLEKENGDIDIFFEFDDTVYAIICTYVDCLRIDHNNEISHHNFNVDCFYSGYALKDDNYYYELGIGSRYYYKKNEGKGYYHYLVE